MMPAEGRKEHRFWSRKRRNIHDLHHPVVFVCEAFDVRRTADSEPLPASRGFVRASPSQPRVPQTHANASYECGKTTSETRQETSDRWGGRPWRAWAAAVFGAHNKSSRSAKYENWMKITSQARSKRSIRKCFTPLSCTTLSEAWNPHFTEFTTSLLRCPRRNSKRKCSYSSTMLLTFS